MKPNILANTKEISHDQWLEIRRQGIGGSDAAAILGLNPYSSAFSVYLDKLGLVPPQDETEAMWLGTKLEPIIAERFSEQTGMAVQRRNAIYQHPEFPWMLANIDRWIVGKNAGLEIKTTNMLNRTKFEDGEIPPSYYVQCVHYMAVTGADEWYLAVAVLNKAFHVFHVERNEEEITSLIEAERRFWEEHVMKQIPPAPDGSDRAGELLKNLYPRAKGESSAELVPLFGIEQNLERLQEIDAEVKALENEADAIKQSIQLQIGEAEGGRANGYTIWWKNQSRTSLDTTRLKKENPEIYNQYSKVTVFRKFELKKEA